MSPILNYGSFSKLELDLPPEVLVAECGAPPRQPLEDLPASVAAALSAPLDYPPLDLATVPGDRVALALDQDVPQVEVIIAKVVQSLMAGGVEPDHIVVVQPGGDARQSPADPRSALPGSLADAVNYRLHDPADKRELCFLATSHAGHSLYLNRALCEADLVVPIGCLRLDHSLDYYGVYGSLFPALADEETVQRYRTPIEVKANGAAARRQKEVDEVGWLLGVRLTVQVLPGPGGTVLAVVAGDVDSVRPRGQSLCREAWSCTVPHRARLVVASIGGGDREQTWDNVARALAAAGRAVTEDGSIAVCTDLASGPGPALMRLRDAQDIETAQRQIRHEHSFDARPAAELAHALERGSVYLLSRLEDEVVEQLGMAPVADGEQIARLAHRSDSCILLANAQHAVPTAEDE